MADQFDFVVHAFQRPVGDAQLSRPDTARPSEGGAERDPANYERFPLSPFASWLRFCPDKRVSGGKVLSSRTGPTKNRAALPLRMAAQSLHRSQTFLGEFFRRMRSRLGAPKAITAAAHKLARIVYHLLITRQPYDESIFVAEEIRFHNRKEARLRAQARELGFQLVPSRLFVRDCSLGARDPASQGHTKEELALALRFAAPCDERRAAEVGRSDSGAVEPD